MFPFGYSQQPEKIRSLVQMSIFSTYPSISSTTPLPGSTRAFAGTTYEVAMMMILMASDMKASIMFLYPRECVWRFQQGAQLLAFHWLKMVLFYVAGCFRADTYKVVREEGTPAQLSRLAESTQVTWWERSSSHHIFEFLHSIDLRKRSSGLGLI